METQSIPMHKSPASTKPKLPLPLPPERSMQGDLFHLQDILHRTMQSQWQRQKQCQIHSLLTIVWQQPPQRTALPNVLMPALTAHPAAGQVSLSVIYPLLPAQHTQMLKYLIGPSALPVAVLQGAWMPGFTVWHIVWTRRSTSEIIT